MTNFHRNGSEEDNMFVVNLHRKLGAEPMVESCVALFPNLSHRVRFREEKRVRDVFSAEVEQSISRMVSELDTEMQVISKPDFAIERPGLVLAGLRIISSKVEDGKQIIVIRFKHFIGGLQAAFRSDIGFGTPRLAPKEEIAISVLDDIVRPLYDLVSSVDVQNLPDHHRRNIEDRLKQIADQTVDLRFYSSLLMRYIAQTQKDGGLGHPLLDAPSEPKHLRSG